MKFKTKKDCQDFINKHKLNGFPCPQYSEAFDYEDGLYDILFWFIMYVD